jgi:hypothetical protein
MDWQTTTIVQNGETAMRPILVLSFLTAFCAAANAATAHHHARKPHANAQPSYSSSYPGWGNQGWTTQTRVPTAYGKGSDYQNWGGGGGGR